MAAKGRNQFFHGLKEALEEALAYERGEKMDLRVTVVPDPPERIRPSEMRKTRASLKAGRKSSARQKSKRRPL